ncbi:MAG: hypothetical protein A4E64_03195 [Syntrophorhabdus sp. PtaU1.Bin058]|nr:MAG: hypothetical protein A4E64_03195 [Syntrophorhabdus sp. PtaU1.Bin058]
MSPEAKTEHTAKEILLNAAKAIQYAGDYLGQAVKATYGYDPKIVEQINVESKSLNAFLTQLMQVRDIADDDLFAKSTSALKLQIASLHEMSDRIKSVASDTATAPGVAGYMEQTVTLIAQAVSFIAQLP